MRLLFASSEVFPFSKSGGLAEVATALPRALVELGHEVVVVTPWYRTLAAEPARVGGAEVAFGGGFERVSVGSLECAGVRFAFVGHDLFHRDQLYGYSDDVRRFCLFTRSIPQVGAHLGFLPEVVHANDWHTAYLPLLFEQGRQLPEGWTGLPSLLTIHNIQYQGVSEPEETLHWLCLPATLKEGSIGHFGAANALQAGLSLAGQVTTVSPSYAQEIATPEYGYGLDETVRTVAPKLSGLLNGLDTDLWDPASDPHLPRPYRAGDLGGKVEAKGLLGAELGLGEERPLLGLVSRLADQKGIDLLLEGAHALFEQGWSIVLLGSGDAGLEASAQELAAANPGTMAVRLGFNEGLAHRIYAGCDALAIPSRFEPCGLAQMIAMRYGTLPIARATGGLRDTIEQGRTGFLFEQATPEAFVEAAAEARSCYGTERWTVMVGEAMQEDFSWTGTARRYNELYGRLRR